MGRRWCADLLRNGRRGPRTTHGRLRRSDPQGRETGRPTDRAPHQVRPHHQPEDGEGARPDDPVVRARTGDGADPVTYERARSVRPLPRRRSSPTSQASCVASHDELTDNRKPANCCARTVNYWAASIVAIPAEPERSWLESPLWA